MMVFDFRQKKNLLLVVFMVSLFVARPVTSEVKEEDLFFDDFGTRVEGRWEAVKGAWEVHDGRMVHADVSKYDHDFTIADFPFRSGTIETVGIAQKINDWNFASIGLLLKYVDKDHYLYFRYGSYGSVNVEGRAPGWKGLSLGEGKPELGRPYRLKAVFKNGLIGISVNGIMQAVFYDPLANMTGRAGVFTEAHAEFDDFRITREPARK